MNLWDSEATERYILTAKMTNGHRNNLQYAYMDWARSQGFDFKPRRFKREEKLPYVPTEVELDVLISGCGGRVRVFLQLLKESAFRPVEAFSLTPRDLDLVRSVCTLNHPAKNSRPRRARSHQKHRAYNQFRRGGKRFYSGSRALVLPTQIELFTQLFPYLSPVKYEHNYTSGHWEEHNIIHQGK